MARWAHDLLFDSLVRELVEARAANIEMDSTGLRGMADIKKDERAVGKELERRADAERATFREMLEDADRRSGARPIEVSYDSADPDQERRADLVARYLVSLGYAEMRTEEEHAARPRYRVRFRWERLARWREPGE